MVGGVAGQWGLETLGDRGTDFWTGALCHGIATLGYLMLCRAVIADRWRPRLGHALALALGIRLLALPLGPALSDDVYRYLHEGTMVVAGENPYLTAPAEVAPEFRHPEYWSLINHREIPAAYPPATQVALAAGVTLVPHPLGMKLLFGTCDLLVFLVLWFWLPAVGSRSGLAVLHGWCPLLALEFAGEGHSDSLAVLFVVLSLYACARGRVHLGAGTLALAAASKLMPAVWLPFVLRGRWWATLTFALTLGICYLPFCYGVAWVDLPRLFTGTLAYASEWRGNDSAFHLLRIVAAESLQWLDRQGVHTRLIYYPHNVAKVPIVLVGLAVLVLAWRRRWRLPKVAAVVCGMFVVFTPTMHPWYLAFLVPFFCLYPSVAWLVFTGTIYLAYEPRPDWIQFGVWEEDLWCKVLEYLPFYVGILHLWILRRRRRVTAGAPEHS